MLFIRSFDSGATARLVRDVCHVREPGFRSMLEIGGGFDLSEPDSVSGTNGYRH